MAVSTQCYSAISDYHVTTNQFGKMLSRMLNEVFSIVFRIRKQIYSTLNLEIEFGRFHNIERDERKCRLCNMNAVESENHFLLCCPNFTKSKVTGTGVQPHRNRK